MKGKDWNQLGIAADTDDALDLSLAIATRGVLEGASDKEDLLSKPGQWEASLAALMNGPGFVHWREPGSVYPKSHTGALSAVALAEAWKASLANVGKPVRIAVEPSTGVARGAADAALLARPFATLEQHRRAWPATSVFTQAELAPQGLQHGFVAQMMFDQRRTCRSGSLNG